ncbi:thiamine phosphate synthase [Virgibacillus pantothenticus]|uniref:thiamine phosphate synthase n=1 Tax=Virgibacillus pantothenticus TaxID=1473 RepID=UPI0009847477|nr:thiamine phosphate synthase [Virgibacillus pantothenticus]
MQLYAVTNGKMEEAKLVDTIQVIAPFVDRIILREKQKSLQGYLAFVQKLIQAGVSKEVLCIHNHVSAPALTEVNQLHLPENKASLIADMKKLSPSLQVGVSVHSLQAARHAERCGADYVMFGHVFATASKPRINPRGFEQVKQLAHALTIPVIAIGGIKNNKICDLSGANISGIAVMSAIFSASSPQTAAMKLREEVRRIEATS